jgi:hypothetical protein
MGQTPGFAKQTIIGIIMTIRNRYRDTMVISSGLL